MNLLRFISGPSLVVRIPAACGGETRGHVTEALARHGRPEIFNSDQGSQFTSADFLKVLKDAEIAISMDGKPSPPTSVSCLKRRVQRVPQTGRIRGGYIPLADLLRTFRWHHARASICDAE